MIKGLSILLLLSTCAFGQAWSGILAPARAVDWSGAGATIPVRNTICATETSSRTAAQINADIASCGAGQVVLLSAGTYNLSAGFVVNAKSDVTIRGEGSNQTFLVFSGDYSCSGLTAAMCLVGSTSGWGGTMGISPNHTATLSGSLTQGSTSLTFSSVTGLSIGNQFTIDQCNNGLTTASCTGTQADNGAVFTCAKIDTGAAGISSVAIRAGGSGYSSPPAVSFGGGGSAAAGTAVLTGGVVTSVTMTNAGSGYTTPTVSFSGGGGSGATGYASPARVCPSVVGPGGGADTGRDQFQIVTVTNIAGNVVTFTPGLYMPNWDASLNPRAYWATSPKSGVGVENLSIDFTASGAQSAIIFWNCFNCWARGIRSIFTTRTSNGTQRNHFWLLTSAHVTVRDSYMYGSTSPHSLGYGVEAFNTSDSLFENNIGQNIPAPIDINADCEGCVAGYNFDVNDVNDANYLWNGLDIHGPAEYFLAEGNVGQGFRADRYHGNSNFDTMFRNYWLGWASGTITNGLNPYITESVHRYFNVIGNVLGKTGVQTNYRCNSSICPGSAWIYEMGDSAGGAAPADPLTTTSAMLWGNYDVVNASTSFVSGDVPSAFNDTSGTPSLFVNPVPASQALPASFYLPAKPAWFRTITWPPIGPDVTGGNLSGVGGYANMIPAQNCYLNIMGGPADGSGSELAFESDVCYVAAGATMGGGISISGGTSIK